MISLIALYSEHYIREELRYIPTIVAQNPLSPLIEILPHDIPNTSDGNNAVSPRDVAR